MEMTKTETLKHKLAFFSQFAVLLSPETTEKYFPNEADYADFMEKDVPKRLEVFDKELNNKKSCVAEVRAQVFEQLLQIMTYRHVFTEQEMEAIVEDFQATNYIDDISSLYEEKETD